MTTKDKLWKAIIADYFQDFTRFFLPDLYPDIDWKRGIVFMDKELDELYPDSEQDGRRVDVLARIYLKNGTERWILVHAEVQGYLDWDIGKRVFTSWYRLIDRYAVETTCLVVYVDKHPSYHVRGYELEFSGTNMAFDFNTYKVLENKVETYKKSKNPFSIPLEFVWHDIQSTAPSDEDWLEIKTKLLRKTVSISKRHPTIRNLLYFLKEYKNLEKPKNQRKFDHSLNTIDMTAVKPQDTRLYKLAVELEAERVAVKMAEKMADGMAKELAKEMADGMAKEMADGMAKEMADGMAKEMADSMAKEMADGMAKEMADSMAKEMADSMAKEMVENKVKERTIAMIFSLWENGASIELIQKATGYSKSKIKAIVEEEK